MGELPTASQTVGPFFSIGMTQLQRAEIAADAAAEGISVRGRLLDGGGEGVPDAVLEIWRPSARSTDEQASEGADWYPKGFARVATNDRGEFTFGGPKPVARKAADGSAHAPHFVVLVFMRGLLKHLVTRLYFSGEASNSEDSVLHVVPADRQATIIAAHDGKAAGHFLWDIRLQGEQETVFFET